MNIKSCLILIVTLSIGVNCEVIGKTIYSSPQQSVDGALCVELDYVSRWPKYSIPDSLFITTEGYDNNGDRINKTIAEIPFLNPSSLWKTFSKTVYYDNPGRYSIYLIQKDVNSPVSLTFNVKLNNGKCQSESPVEQKSTTDDQTTDDAKVYERTIYTSEPQSVDSDLCFELNYVPISFEKYKFQTTDSLVIKTEGTDVNGKQISNTIDEIQFASPSNVWKNYLTTIHYENPGTYTISLIRKNDNAQVSITFGTKLNNGKCN